MTKTVHEHLRAHMMQGLGMERPTLAELEKDQWDNRFETLMRNRMIMGAFRYAPLCYQMGGNYDNIGSIMRRCEAYQEDGNGEHLVDIANIALVEWVTKRPEFHAVDDGIHTDKKEIVQ